MHREKRINKPAIYIHLGEWVMQQGNNLPTNRHAPSTLDLPATFCPYPCKVILFHVPVQMFLKHYNSTCLNFLLQRLIPETYHPLCKEVALRLLVNKPMSSCCRFPYSGYKTAILTYRCLSWSYILYIRSPHHPCAQRNSLSLLNLSPYLKPSSPGNIDSRQCWLEGPTPVHIVYCHPSKSSLHSIPNLASFW